MGFDEQFKQALADIRAVAGKKVKYARGSDFVWINAARGNTQFSVDEENSFRIEYEEKEFLIGADDLVLAGSVVKPQRGDSITEEYGNKTFTYTVIETTADDVWAWSDAGKSTLRVFTKLKSEANT